MSRSFRKPATAITGTKSAKDDKRHAHRGVRRRQNQYLKDFIISEDWDNFLMPDIYECSFNDVWGWGRDGSQSIQSPPRYGGYFGTWEIEFGPEDAEEHYQEDLERYERLKRK